MRLSADVFVPLSPDSFDIQDRSLTFFENGIMVHDKSAQPIGSSRFRLLASQLPFDPSTTAWRVAWKMELISGTVGVNDFRFLLK